MSSKEFRNLKVRDKHSSWNGKMVNVQVENSKIVSISLSSDVVENGMVFPGFVDIRSHLPDPGEEWKESINSFTEAAQNAGFNHVFFQPSGSIHYDSAEMVKSFRSSTENSNCSLYLVGNLSRKGEGEEMAELFQMSMAGTRLFSDGNHSQISSGFLQRALEYSKSFPGTLMPSLLDFELGNGFLVNEGKTSLHLGIKGSPSLAEYATVQKLISILRYSGGSMHIGPLSCSESVQLIREAKVGGLEGLSCDTSLAHLVFTESSLDGYDTTYKLLPPLRSVSDRDALWAGLADGTIDCISSNHNPQGIDEKRLEFNHAEFGMSVFDVFLEYLFSEMETRGLEFDLLTDVLSSAPRKITGLNKALFEEGEDADFVIISGQKSKKESGSSRFSKGINVPLSKQALEGVIAHCKG